MSLNFPDSPSLNDTYTSPSGVDFVWDGSKWRHQQQPGPVPNDPTFDSLTVGDGISVTGGDSATIGTGIARSGDNLDIVSGGNLCLQAYGNGGALFGRTTADIGSLNLSYSGGDVSHTVGNIFGLQQQITFNSGASATDAFSFYAVGVNNGGATANYTGYGVATTPSATKNFGFRSDINTEAGKENYGFYALGNANNYFNGHVICNTGITTDYAVVNHGIDYLEGARFSFMWEERNGVMVSRYNINAGAERRFLVDSGQFNSITLNWASSSVNANVDNVLSVVLGTASDYRIKENVTPLPSAVETVKALKPVNYNIKDTTFNSLEVKGSDDTVTGFLAHEVDALIPGAATGVKDDPNNLQSINTYPIVAVLTKALQEVIAKNEELEARLAILEEGN